jgi:hypothetical protein
VDGHRFAEVRLSDGRDAYVPSGYLTPHASGAMNAAGGRYDPRLAKEGYTPVVVRAGDTIWGIAALHDASIAKTIALNSSHIDDPNEIYPGDVVYLP